MHTMNSDIIYESKLPRHCHDEVDLVLLEYLSIRLHYPFGVRKGGHYTDN